MFKFLRSRHRKLYIKLGSKYNVWPEKVYKLAHGKHSNNSKDSKILHELLSEGVIHRHRTSYDTFDVKKDEDGKTVLPKY